MIMTSEWQGDNHKIIRLAYFVNNKAKVTRRLTTQRRLYQQYPKKVKPIFCTENFITLCMRQMLMTMSVFRITVLSELSSLT